MIEDHELQRRLGRLPGGTDLYRRLRGLPGGTELCKVANGRSDIELVGGAVRDLLLNRSPRELDVVVGSDPTSFLQDASLLARELASELGVDSAPNEHERFGTAVVQWSTDKVDIAARRAETYATPGALPDVRAGSPEEDLQRRDFTVNAIALSLNDAGKGGLRTVAHALEDLVTGQLRVLHDRSFLDDPTRLLRLARYAGRLDFTVEPHTAQLVKEALAVDALSTVSGGRIGSELRLTLEDPGALAAFEELDRMGVLSVLHPRLHFERPLLVAALALLPDDGLPCLLLLTALALPLALRADKPAGAEVKALLDRWQFPAPDRDRVLAGTLAVPRLLDQLPGCRTPAELYTAAAGAPLEAVALAGALGAAAAARRWLEHLRHVDLQITGEDLLAEGVPSGPEIGALLRATLRMRLDGELDDDRDAQLAAALRFR